MPDQRTYYEVIRDCCSESTAHGIPLVFKRQEVSLKIFWLICTLASAGVCGWLVANSIMDFFTYDTVTKSQLVFETPAIFPTVSFCSHNMFMTEKGFAYVEKTWEELTGVPIDWILPHYLQKDFDILKYFIGANLFERNSTDEKRKEMSLQINDMLFTCNFNNLYCDADDFYYYYDPYFG